MKDNYGDKVTVEVAPGYDGPDAVSMIVRHNDTAAEHVYTPAKARKLAKKLRAAADEVDPPVLSFVDEVASFEAHADEALAIAEGASAYRLTLTQDEAETLAVVLAKIGGPMGYPGTGTSARAHAETAASKLAALGVDGVALCDDERYATANGFLDAIYFKARA